MPDKWHIWFPTNFVQTSKNAECELNMIFSFAFAEYEIKWACLHGLWLFPSGLQNKYVCVPNLWLCKDRMWE